MIWRNEAFKAAKEEGIDIAAKSNTDLLLESLIETVAEATKAVIEMLKLVAQASGMKFLA